MTDKTYEKGLAGESQAVQYLQKQGMLLLHKRYRAPGGEIDAMMTDGDTLVFVEVKLRQTGTSGDGLMAVTTKKQRRIVKAALYYLAEHDHDGPIRFDVVEVTGEGIQHIKDAFQGKEF
ncbi:MAG TPA: YraN family protein [Candidatus Limiplasma sp.]|nr:YraN family protein [Candidatus Limiplasma sp.]